MSKIEDFKHGYDFFNRFIDMNLILMNRDIREEEVVQRLDEKAYDEFVEVGLESNVHINSIDPIDFRNLGIISAALLRPLDYLKGTLYLTFVYPLKHYY